MLALTMWHTNTNTGNIKEPRLFPFMRSSADSVGDINVMCYNAVHDKNASNIVIVQLKKATTEIMQLTISVFSFSMVIVLFFGSVINHTPKEETTIPRAV